MEKKKVIVHYNNLPPEVLEVLKEKYPDGYQNHTFKVTKPNNDFFYAVTVDTKDTSYLIKVDVKIDNVTENKLDDAIFSNEDATKVVGKIPDDEIAEEDADDESKPTKSKTDKEDDMF
jgi:hypothetical protein